MTENEGADWFLRSQARMVMLKDLHSRLQRVTDPSKELPDLMNELQQLSGEMEADPTPPTPTSETRDQIQAILEQRYGNLPKGELVTRAVSEGFQEIDELGMMDERLAEVRDKVNDHLRHRRQEK